MATSGSATTSKYDGRYGKVSWTSTQSGNKLTVNYTMELVGGNSSWYITSYFYFKVTCSGAASTSAGTIYAVNGDTSYKGYTGTIKTGSFTVTLNGSGGTMKFEVSLATYQHSVNCTGSNSWTLPSAGLVWICTDVDAATWEQAIPWICTDADTPTWEQAIPWICTDADAATWEICS